MRLPTDRALRTLIIGALEDLAEAEHSGRWLDAVSSLETVTAELRARASGRAPPSLDAGRRERLTRAERGDR
jgi:hypothetical protein